MPRPHSTPKMPCPFCGSLHLKSQAMYNLYNERHGYKIMCERCHAQGPMRKQHNAAVKKWDTRKEPK